MATIGNRHKEKAEKVQVDVYFLSEMEGRRLKAFLSSDRH